MRTSDRGSEARAGAAPPPRPRRRRASRGFTLIELMVVVALVAIAAGVASLALRDGDEDRLERDALRLVTLLEIARAEARAAALVVRWVPTPERPDEQFRFEGLPASRKLPARWLDARTFAEPAPAAIVLGPEALIGAQRIRLRLAARSIDVVTDGLRPFGLQAVPAP